MGLENRVIYDLVNVIEGTCRLKQALVRDKRYEGLYLLPAAQTRDKSAVNPEQMQKLCASILEEGFDYVIIDCPAGIEQGFKNAIAGADKAIVVTTPEISAVRDADRIIGMLEANGLMNSKLILNRIRVDMVARNEMMSLEDVEEILAIDTLGIIPDDESIVISTNKGEPAVTNTDSLAGEAYQNIVKRILGENVPLMSLCLQQEPPYLTNYLVGYTRIRSDIMYDNNSSGSIAKDRLKYILLKDKVSCTKETLDMLKQDIVELISNYIDIDKYNTKLTFEQKSDVSYVNIKIPLIKDRMK